MRIPAIGISCYKKYKRSLQNSTFTRSLYGFLQSVAHLGVAKGGEFPTQQLLEAAKNYSFRL